MSFTRREFLAAAAALAPASEWRSEVPADCPFARSSAVHGITFTGRQASYTGADTWYPSWAADGKLYSPWTDGKVGNVGSSSAGRNATTGSAIILGDSPLDLSVTDARLFKGDPAPYGGRYPCGSLVYNGVWYYGTYCLMDTDGDPSKGLNWDVLGPFVGFRWSRDLGASWTDTPHTPAKPIFGEPARQGGPVKIGAPHFVDFGRNIQHSPDGKAYLVGHGAVAGDPSPRAANLSWITGDQIYLARVEPSVENMNDPGKYEFFAGADGRGKPRWTRELAKAQPVCEWNNRAGCVTATYVPGLRRYLMFVTDGTDTISRFNTWVLEAEALTGPWRIVTFMRNFGEQGYFVNLPSKFIAPDGRSAWLLYSANFTNGYLKTTFAANPPGSRYGMCLQEIRFT